MRSTQSRVIQIFPAILLPGIAACGLLACFGASPDPAGNAARGKALFEKRCTGCHALDINKEGPRLRGVYGRAAGTAPGFEYSGALKAAQFRWDDERLEKWLSDTQTVLPGNDMDFHVPKTEERADIIAYLRSLSGGR